MCVPTYYVSKSALTVYVLCCHSHTLYVPHVVFVLRAVNASAQFAKAVFAIELASVPWFERLVGAIDLGSLIVTIMVCPPCC